MKPRARRTSDIATAVSVHSNTVRLCEEWGFLPPIPRSPSGYRLFTAAHLDQMRLARAALGGPWPGRTIKQSALTLVRRAAAGDLGGAPEQAYRHLALVQAECAQAEAAAELLERWAHGTAAASWPIVVATAMPKRNGPAKLPTALSRSALRDSIACEGINVATVLALSWKPFRKSNASAVTMNNIRNGEIPDRLATQTP